MGDADQLGKRIFNIETARVTDGAVCWSPPQELALGAQVQSDGLLEVVDAARLLKLDPPWSLLPGSAVVELKMPGDHTDLESWLRARLRREAWDLNEHLKRLTLHASPGEAAAAWAGPAALLYITPHLPRWIQQGFDLTFVSEGCWQVGPAPPLLIWVAANQLPLRPDLLPFLALRSGRAAVEALPWFVEHASPAWLKLWMENLKMTSDALKTPPPNSFDEEDDLQGEPLPSDLVLEILYQRYPPVRARLEAIAREEGREEGRQESEGALLGVLARIAARRLGRDLTPQERSSLHHKTSALGAEATEERLAASRPEEVARWLSEDGLAS